MLSLLRRVKARGRLNKRVVLYYHPDYAPASLTRASRVPDMPIDRSELVIEQLAREGLVHPGDVRMAQPVTMNDLLLAHSSAYIEASAQPELLARIFGLAPEWVDVDELLVAQRLAVGGTLAAAAAVTIDGEHEIAVNLGGGFHHAQPERGSGFCVYNDVAVAVAGLRTRGFGGRVAIVDLDFHQGDGNVVAFAADPEVFTYSLHGSTWTHVEALANRQIWLPTGTDDRIYLDCLHRTLPACLEEHQADLIFYIAGNDTLAGDRLGDFCLTPAGVMQRDRLVIECARRLGAPVVITLAGGYSRFAWHSTANLLRWLLCDDARTIEPASPPDVRREFARIFAQLSPADLQREDDLTFTEADLLGDLGPRRRRRLVLDYYSVQGIEFALEKYGVLEKIRRMGFYPVDIRVDPSDPAHQVLRVLGAKDGGPMHLLVELVARRQWIAVPSAVVASGQVEVLGVEWLLLQDPTSEFTLERPQLPGQEYPGLHLSREIIELLVRICMRLRLEAVLNRPAHFHTAAFVSPGFHFLDPMVEGQLLALCRVLADLALADASRLVEEGAVQTADGTPLVWQSVEHLLPLSGHLTSFFQSTAYCSAATSEMERLLAEGLSVSQPSVPRQK